MKSYLKLASIFFLFASVNVFAVKSPPAGGGVTGKANMLFMIDNSGSMEYDIATRTNMVGAPQDSVVDSKGELYVKSGVSCGWWCSDAGDSNRWLFSRFKPDLSPNQGLRRFYSNTFRKEEKPYHSKVAIDSKDTIHFVFRPKDLRTPGAIHRLKTSNSFLAKIDIPLPSIPLAIDIDTDDNIWVTTNSSSKTDHKQASGPYFVRKLDSDGVELTNWEIPADFITPGIPTVAEAGPPLGISVYDDKVYVVSQITETRSGRSGQFGRSNVHAGTFSDCKRGYPVRVYDAVTGDELDKWWALGGDDIEVNANGVYVMGTTSHSSDQENNPCGGQVGKYSYDGVLEARFAPQKTICTAPASVEIPRGISSDADGNIYVVGGGSGTLKNGFMAVKKYDLNGDFIATISESQTRKVAVKCMLHKLLSTVSLTDKVNFGLQVWASSAQMLTKVSETGASEIIPMLCRDCRAAYNRQRVCECGTSPDRGYTLARQYYKNSASGFTPGPIDPTKCETHAILFLSDGMFTASRAEAAVRDLASSLDVKSYVVGFGSGFSGWVKRNYEAIAKAGGTFPTTPIFMDDADKLRQLIETLALQMRASGLSFTGAPPMIAELGVGDFIYQASFKIPAIGQWQGRLHKYSLNATTGKVGAVEWEAGSLLKAKNWRTGRNIFTAPYSGSGATNNNFLAAGVGALKPMLFDGVAGSDADAIKIIEFVRGRDAFDEDNDGDVTDERLWKLGDPYHSAPIIVGPPKALDAAKAKMENSEEKYKEDNGYVGHATANSSREAVIYVGANDAMLHAFKDSNGEELWGFIPPSLLSRLRTMDSGVNHVTIPIYGVDGTPVAKEVFYGGRWRTVLVAGLGRDGFGYFALDITNPTEPKFLFAFSNDPENEVIRHWNSAGTLTKQNYSSVSNEFDYRRIGEAMSLPTITSIPHGGSRKWVVNVGGGYNITDDKDYGSAVYVLDLEREGRVLKLNDIADNAGGFNNSTPGQVTAVTADSSRGSAKYAGAMLYSADMESKLSKFNLTNKGVIYDSTEVFDGEGNTVNQRASFSPVTVSTDSSDLAWVFFGTGNLDKVQMSLSTIQNRIFGIKDKKFPEFEKVTKSTISVLKDVTNSSSSCPVEADLGWYINLKRDEKVTDKIQIEDKILYVPLYTPDPTLPCFPGKSALSQLGYGCGREVERTDLGSGYVTGIRIYKDKVYAGISGVADSDADKEIDVEDGFKKRGNIVSGSPAAAPSSPDDPQVKIESWRERF
jgi:hypothetical protein